MKLNLLSLNRRAGDKTEMTNENTHANPKSLLKVSETRTLYPPFFIFLFVF